MKEWKPLYIENYANDIGSVMSRISNNRNQTRPLKKSLYYKFLTLRPAITIKQDQIKYS